MIIHLPMTHYFIYVSIVLTLMLTLDYRCEDRNIVGMLRGDIDAIRWVLTLPESPIITPKKRTVQPGNAFEDTAF
jgi:hypothetical protein